ncbi:MAG: outer membrane scaffolding protein for murein synthesis (MipA/OmpV family) [Phenylobacterium sp.]|jgi:outer membrane scaffolding protein for murein synthesis (MipA/OmpV family)
MISSKLNKQALGALMIAALSTLSVQTQAAIETRSDDPLFKPQWDVTLGLGAMSVAMPWKGIDRQTAALPYFDLSYGNWQFSAEQLVKYQYPLPVGENISVFAGLNYRDDSYDAKGTLFSETSDDPVFADYERLDGEVLFNAGVQWNDLSFSIAQDVSDNTSATSAHLAWELPLYTSSFGLMVNASAKVNWYSEDYVNYYYGIAGDQIKNSVGRVAYQADAATNVELGLNVVYPINQSWAVVGFLSRTRLDDSITDSPLIDSQYSDTVALMLTHRM